MAILTSYIDFNFGCFLSNKANEMQGFSRLQHIIIKGAGGG
jgi:hypothetical protein